MRLRWIGSATFVFVVIAGCSQSSPSSGPESSIGTAQGGIQQADGTPGVLDGAAHPFAVGVCKGNKGACTSYCSGALILPNLVVTARHCVDKTEKIINCTINPQFEVTLPRTQQWITTNSTMGTPTSPLWHQVKSWIVPADDHVCNNDIALLVLQDQIAATEAKPAIPGVQYPMGDINRYVHRFTAIGYGNTGPTGFSAGTRRIRTGIPVECIPGDDFIPCPTSTNDFIKPNEFFGGDGTCEGDSGSSAFEDKTLVKGAPVSFGVLSRGGDNAGDAGQQATLCKGSLYTRLDKFRDLVVQAAVTASGNWTLYPRPSPDWTIYIPPPAEAGAPDAGPKKPLGEGFACETNEQCISKVCADTGAGKACTQACDESVVPTTCQEGYLCKESVCVQDLGGGGGETVVAAAPGPTTTTESCALVLRPRSRLGAFALPVFAGLGLGVVLGLALRRRRRPASKRD